MAAFLAKKLLENTEATQLAMEIKFIVKASWSVKFTSRSKQEAHIPLASKSEICYEEDIREFLHFVKLKIKNTNIVYPSGSPGSHHPCRPGQWQKSQ